MIMFSFRVSMFYLILLHFIFTRAQLAREIMHLMNRHILHQNNSLCSEIKPAHYETCELHDPNDNKPLGNQCVSEEGRCSDGSYNKTCIILFMGENEPGLLCVVVMTTSSRRYLLPSITGADGTR